MLLLVIRWFRLFTVARVDCLTSSQSTYSRQNNNLLFSEFLHLWALLFHLSLIILGVLGVCTVDQSKQCVTRFLFLEVESWWQCNSPITWLLLSLVTASILFLDPFDPVTASGIDLTTSSWILDFGCHSHMCYNRDFFNTYTSCDGKSIFMANNAECKSMGLEGRESRCLIELYEL